MTMTMADVVDKRWALSLSHVTQPPGRRSLLRAVERRLPAIVGCAVMTTLMLATTSWHHSVRITPPPAISSAYAALHRSPVDVAAEVITSPDGP